MNKSIFVVVEVNSGIPVEVRAFSNQDMATEYLEDLRNRMNPDNDEAGIVIVPLLRGVLPAESSRRELDIAAFRSASQKALVIHPMILMSEQGIPEETLKSIFEGELKDLRMKSFQYFNQFFQQRYNEDEAENNSHLALELISLLIKSDDANVKKLLEEATHENRINNNGKYQISRQI